MGERPGAAHRPPPLGLQRGQDPQPHGLDPRSLSAQRPGDVGQGAPAELGQASGNHRPHERLHSRRDQLQRSRDLAATVGAHRIARPNVARLNVARLNVARLNVARLNVARLNVARLNVARLNVARLNVARLNVAHRRHAPSRHARVPCGTDLPGRMLDRYGNAIEHQFDTVGIVAGLWTTSRCARRQGRPAPRCGRSA
ncbi:hypothetical protein GCM10009809_26060 [Isoptericola hypogeus]|uniref:Pentapeptide repeat-containing protein n=1 Tax=Isoptericola hypogeus TaxID=300179 RepID=A0ABN2JJC7_9MICO